MALRRPALAWLPALTVLAMLGPVAAGLAGTIAPALGYFPAIGAERLSFGPLEALFGWGGIWRATALSLTTGLGTTLVSLGLVVLIVAGWSGTQVFIALRTVLSPLLSVPHAAAAFGLAFLIAPSGWIVRALSPWATGWEKPPDLLIVQDPHGLALMAGLIVKEVPFLLLMTLAALGQSNGTRAVMVAQTLGYGRVRGWLLTVFPQIYAQIRLPVYVVLAYAMSVVDVAIVLGPNTPATLSVQIVRWMADPDLSMRLVAAAGALWQAVLVVGAILLWRVGEVAAAALGRRWVNAGARGWGEGALRQAGLFGGVVVVTTVVLGLASLALWSVAGAWNFPAAWPDGLTGRSWMRHGPEVAMTAWETAVIASVAVLIALVLTVGCLEAEHRYRLRMSRRALTILYLPLIVPQVAFLPGLQKLMLMGGLKSGIWAVVAAHVVFVLPYVFLSLGDPYRAWDPRYGTVAAALGAGRERILWRVRLPMLLAPVLTALTVGLAVSVGQYLPTLLIGGGRVQTLTTEAVALASGGDRRAIGVYGLAQTVAALLPFAAAVLIPALVWRNRRGLAHG